MARRILISSFVFSLGLHLLGLVGYWHWLQEEDENELFRARFARPLRFEEPVRLPAQRPELAAGQMEYVASVAGGRLAAVEPAQIAPLAMDQEPMPQLGTSAGGALPKAGGPQLAVEERPQVGGPTYIDSSEFEGFELLPLDVLARVDDKRAVVIADPNSRQGLKGFINFTMLRLDGANSFALDVASGAELGTPLESLARYLRDYTQILAQLRGVAQVHFLSSELAKDPIHFLFPGQRLITDQAQRVYLSQEEQVQLGTYLKNGGFVLVDAWRGSDSRRFLRETVGYLQQILGSEARLIEVPLGHPLYHAFYDYPSGFPGEEKGPSLGVAFNSWSYPDRGPCSTQPPRGMWGVEYQGELVALISDLGLHLAWSGKANNECVTAEEQEPAAEEEEEAPSPNSLVFLRAATNIVVYALTRPSGLTPRRQAPAWSQSRPRVDLATQSHAAAEQLGADDELANGLEAALALVHIPPDKLMKGGVGLKIDQGNAIDILRGSRHGILLRNLAPGARQLEVEYGGFRRRLDIQLVGGQVLTVGIRVERPALFQRLTLKPQTELASVPEWLQRFADLNIEEVFVDEAGSLLRLPELK